MTLLICIDLDDAHIASPKSPQDSEDEVSDADAMMVDGPCE
jgi:hypothetical protein